MRDQNVPSSSARVSNLARTAILVVLLAVLFQLGVSSRTAYLWSNIKNIDTPILYHGQHITSNFFEGWYFKFVKLGGPENDLPQGMAIIPGIYRPPPKTADQGGAHAFVMVLGLPGPERSAYYRFRTDEFVDLGGDGNGDKGAFRVRIGNSLFAHDEIILDLPVNNFDRIPANELESFYAEASQQYEAQYLASNMSQTRPLPATFFRSLFPSLDELKQQELQEPFTVQGHFTFPATTQTPLPTSRLIPSVMGFTAYIPFLECNHGLASLHHPIQRGRIATLYANNEVQAEAIFDGGVGYTEKDWGINFPSTWIWTQSNIFSVSPGSSILMSLASIPVLGPDASEWILDHLPLASSLTHVPGMLLIYYHAASKTLYNFSSYMLSSKIKSLSVTLNPDKRSQTVLLIATTQDPMNGQERIAIQVKVTREMGTGVPLRAPSRAKGRMTMGVEETVVAHTQIKLWRVQSGEVIVEDVGLGSGLEVVGDIQWLEARVNS
ncbi:hypothetical protein EDD21DRAFT_414909 [Dissophora ornata]|nr:hypothetical protein BGZ58_009472 [Dissophora ornata]KAI8601437.1 hypothetical protein EDD21DRAFT_414909 [Dissophora ornata]